MWSARNDELAECPELPLALTDGLLISDSPYTVDETCLVPEVSVALRAWYSNPFRYTRRARHAVAACLVACVGHIAAAPLDARFTHIRSGHGCCQVPYHVIMPGNLFVQQVQSFGRLYTPLEHNFATV